MAQAVVTYHGIIGTPDQLQALGQMTLLFGFLDQQVTQTGATLLSVKDGSNWEENQALLMEDWFSQKVKKVRALFSALGSEHGIKTSKITKLLDTICDLAGHRNDIVHGWITFDEKRRILVFRGRRRCGRSTEAAALKQLNGRLLKCLLALVSCRSEFIEAIAKENANTRATRPFA